MVFLEVFLDQARRNCGIDNYSRASQTNHQRAVKMDLVEESVFFKHYVAAWLQNIGSKEKILLFVTYLHEKIGSFNMFSWMQLKSEAHSLLYACFCVCLCLCVRVLNLVKSERDLNVQQYVTLKLVHPCVAAKLLIPPLLLQYGFCMTLFSFKLFLLFVLFFPLSTWYLGCLVKGQKC